MASGVWIALAMAALAPQAQLTTPDPPVHLRVGVYTYNANGSLAGSASGTADEGADAANIVWVAMGATSCGAGAGMLPSRPDAITWKWAGRVLGQHGTDYLVQVKEGRVTGAAGETWPRAEHNAMVGIGNWVVLDEVPATTGPCSGRIARLEARVELAAAPSATGAGSGARGGAATATGRAGGGSARNGPAPSPLAVDRSPADFLNNELGSVGQRETELSYLADSGQVTVDSRPVLLRGVQASYRAELWLVYTTPEGTGRTFTTLGHIDDAGGTFRFNPLPIRLSSGPTTAIVGANLRPMVTEDGKSVLRVVIARVVQGVSEGASSRAVEMPKTGDVVSFELPQGPVALDGYHFELRVRLTPAG